MKDKDYNNLLSFKNMKGAALTPENTQAIEFLEQLKQNEIVVFKNVTARDLNLHKCYFTLLSEVWGYMPVQFRKVIELKDFYKFVKMQAKQYTVLYTFKDGERMIELDSISFGRMNNQSFKDYVKEQLPVMYEILLIGLDSDFANVAIETIEENFMKYFAKL